MLIYYPRTWRILSYLLSLFLFHVQKNSSIYQKSNSNEEDYIYNKGYMSHLSAAAAEHAEEHARSEGEQDPLHQHGDERQSRVRHVPTSGSR